MTQHLFVPPPAAQTRGHKSERWFCSLQGGFGGSLTRTRRAFSIGSGVSARERQAACGPRNPGRVRERKSNSGMRNPRSEHPCGDPALHKALDVADLKTSVRKDMGFESHPGHGSFEGSPAWSILRILVAALEPPRPQDQRRKMTWCSTSGQPRSAHLRRGRCGSVKNRPRIQGGAA